MVSWVVSWMQARVCPGCPGCPGGVSWMSWGCVLDVLGLCPGRPGDVSWMSWGCVLDTLGMCPGYPGAFPGGVLDVLGVTRVYELNFKRYAQVPPSPNKLNSRLIKQPRPLALARAMAMCFVGGQWSSTQRGTRTPRLPGCPGCPGCVSWMPWGCVLDVLGGVLDVLGGVLDVLDVRLLRILDVLGPLRAANAAVVVNCG